MRRIVLAVLCLACARAVAADGELTLVDFSAANLPIENADRVQATADHAPAGGKAGKVDLGAGFNLNLFVSPNSLAGGTWGQYEQLVVDVFVDGGAVAVGGFIKDPEGKGWWERHNIEAALKPGKNRLAFPLGALDRQNGKGRIDPAKIDFVAIALTPVDAGAPTTLYLQGVRLTKGAAGGGGAMLYAFEGADAGTWSLEDWPEEFRGKSKAEIVAEHATDGAHALKVVSASPAGGPVFAGFAADWSSADALAVDVFNAEDHPVKLGGWVRGGDPKAGWWDRFNWERVIRPGMNAIRLPTGQMRTEGGKPIDLAKVVGFNIVADHATVFIDRVRLAAGGEDVAVKGMRRFDFGPAKSAVMPGFTAVGKDTAWSDAQGYGWQPGGQFGRDFDIMEMLGRHRPPDDLCRDFVMPVRATFSVAVPNGRYGVWLMLAPPGAGWGQTFQHRTVSAEGTVVVDEQYDAASFAAYEYRFEDSEDLPGDDLWSRYIDVVFKPALFDVEVDDGRLDLDFDAHGQWWCAQLNGLMVWPKAVDEDAKRAIDAVQAARKEQYESLHVEQLPAAPAPFAASAADQRRGFVRFVHAIDRDIAVNGQPTAAEAKAERVTIRVPAGEADTGCVGVSPLAPGRLTVEVGDLAGPGGATIPRAAVEARVVRYKSVGHDATYAPMAKYLDAVPKDGVELKPGVLRSFWFTVHVPADAKPGDYRAAIRLKRADGATDEVPLTVSVPPVALDPIAWPIGMFGMSPIVDHAALPGAGDAWWDAVREMVVDAKAHGMTSMDPGVGIPLQRVENGKAIVNFDDMDRFMAIAREAGFTQELNGYALDTGFDRGSHQGDYDQGAREKGAADYASLVRAYFDAVREHAKAKNWLPICFGIDDEFLVHPGGTPEALAAHAKALQDNAPGFHFVAFDSIVDGGDVPAIIRGISAIDTWGAGNHAQRDVDAVRAAKHRLWLYNTGMDRFTFGLYMWFAHAKESVDGFFQWTYNGLGTYGHYYLASHNEASYGVVVPSTHGLRATPVWERLRAGILDHRWLVTASRLIADARKTGTAKAEADALQAVIDGALAPLHFGGVRVDPKAGEGKAENPLAPGALDALRGRLIDGCVAVSRALK